ncbi:MAG: hypothetical protein Q8L01_00655 [Candidatus Woesebacteria bacterium]|nr:hypothetical protein [Candidatus Woesebacteria bacterium]
MDKKTKTIVIVVLAVVVVGGVAFGVNRWRQQQVANQILKEVYGVNTGLFGGLAGGLTGGGKVSDQVANEIAKQIAADEAKQKADEAHEAAKTPADKYNEVKEMATYDAASAALVGEIKGIMEKVFSKAKLTSFSSFSYGEDVSNNVMEFEIPRLATGADLGALTKALTDGGLAVIQSGISDKTAMIIAGSDQAGTYSFSFAVDGQTVDVGVMKASQ